jgi:phage terminase large subunit GpA-like protein
MSQKTICPHCGEKENFHFNYDYTQKDMPVINILCNECGEFFGTNKEEQKRLITEIMEADAKDGLYDQPTAVQWLEELYNNRPAYEEFILDDEFEQAKRMEKEQIINAIMYALDEDGHTGDWKIKFANDYYNKLNKGYDIRNKNG